MSDKSIPLLDLRAQNEPLLPELLQAMERVARSGQFILGPEVAAFEEAVASYLGVPHAIGVSSGTDALLLSLMSLDIGAGDEVITTPFTFFATGGCISRVGAKPIFVDIEPTTFNLDPSKVAAAITPNTRAILPVHLYGQPCNMSALREVATQNELALIEDAAQALGSCFNDQMIGTFGEFGCFSFFPSKNLGGFGDGGLVTTMDDALAEKARCLRVHGGQAKYYHSLIGGNFRIDALQAAVLGVKLPHLDSWAAQRRTNAEHYNQLFAEKALDADVLTTPEIVHDGHVFNQYVIRTNRRDELAGHLQELGIGHAIYYPVCLHLQVCFDYLGYKPGDFPVAERVADEVLALPVFPELGAERQARIVDEVVRFLA